MIHDDDAACAGAAPLSAADVSRRGAITALAGGALIPTLGLAATQAQAGEADDTPVNLALVATPSSLHVSGDTSMNALNSGYEPGASGDVGDGMFGTWPETARQWVQYDWDQPVTIDRTDVYWWVDGRGVGLPRAWKAEYWDGKRFAPVPRPTSAPVAADRYNELRFDPVRTQRLRLVIDTDGKLSVGILQWKAWSHGPVPAFAPTVVAGVDRAVVVGGSTYLSGDVRWLRRGANDPLRWRKASGPGEVRFADATAAETTATFTAPGDYVLQLTGASGNRVGGSALRVRAETPPPAKRLDVVYTTPYSIDSPLWNDRAKALIVSWIPHCIDYCERTDLKTGEGGIDNFVEAGKALRGDPHAGHRGYVFANAWVHQTVESMCIALMVDPRGDPEITAAQARMRETLARWIPVILSAQHPDGYLQTAYTLADRKEWPERWSPDHRENHEGYVAGYFIESAINHHTLTGGKDLRLYDAAKKLADCWVANIGPGKREWFDGHQEMEQALVRFGRFVNDVEGGGRGDGYIKLARFLLDSRRGGSEYDQSHLPPIKQYEAVGHAVRAVYFYSGMADIAAETNDTDYQSAVLSLWDNMVNRKYYVTGGVGSGDTAEGFGKNYALRNDAYCESCSSCGLIFFQYKMNLAYHDARYADLYEETMYNALLGSVDLAGKHFCYTNPLVDTERTEWHVCPCCVGNIPRTLLMLPTWTYAKDAHGINVNLFVGSRINVGEVAGTPVEMVQATDYPWNGKVAITVNPAAPRRFAVRVRVPDRATSAIYTATPVVRGLTGLSVNGEPAALRIEKGYALLEREWRAGDRIEFELPMTVQRIKAIKDVEAARDKVALRYGPLIYNVERADGQQIDKPLSNGPLTATWQPALLSGVVAIDGRWADGSAMRAVPNYARMNRVGRTAKVGGLSSGVDYAPGTQDATPETSAPVKEPDKDADTAGVQSAVWIRDLA